MSTRHDLFACQVPPDGFGDGVVLGEGLIPFGVRDAGEGVFPVEGVVSRLGIILGGGLVPGGGTTTGSDRLEGEPVW